MTLLSMASTILLSHSPRCFPSNIQLCNFNNGLSTTRNPHSSLIVSRNMHTPIKAMVEASSFPLLQQPQIDETPPEMDLADPDFYKIGYVRSFRAYGVEFREGPDGFGVFASKDIEPLRRARMLHQIPGERWKLQSSTGCIENCLSRRLLMLWIFIRRKFCFEL